MTQTMDFTPAPNGSIDITLDDPSSDEELTEKLLEAVGNLEAHESEINLREEALAKAKAALADKVKAVHDLIGSEMFITQDGRKLACVKKKVRGNQGVEYQLKQYKSQARFNFSTE